MKTLSKFVPIKHYKSFYIDDKTTSTQLDKIITEINETKECIIVPYDTWSSKEHIFQMELIKQSFSMKTIIHSSVVCHVISAKINELLSIVFSSSTTIQTWSKSNKDLLYNQVYCGFPTCDTAKVNFVNIQESFKTWYNTTFGHDENCGQILDFNDIDGPLCMCSHRPLKCSHDKWSLSDAIAYTFHEKLDTENRDFPECLAITKLYSYQRKLESSTSP